MAVSRFGFFTLLALVGTLRIVELLLSRRHQKVLLTHGARQVPDPHFHWMVVVHIAVLGGAALEVALLRRPFLPPLVVPMCGLFLLANVVRWWVILTLKECWTVRVMDCAPIGVVTRGPFRFVRHPNYAAVFLELATLPMIHTAWLTALGGSVAHAWVLARRLAVEEPALMANSTYREKMAHKPRFLPGLF
jgi:methyltransferase